MLKNVSSQPVSMMWGGETTTLLPGETCRYKDPRVELRQKAKHVKELEYTPEPKSAEASHSHVIPPASTPPVGEPPATTTASGLSCAVCVFVAKSTAGLDTHIRSKHAS